MVLFAAGRVLRLQCWFTGLVMRVGWFYMFLEAGSGPMEDFSIKTRKLVYGIHLFRLKMFLRQECLTLVFWLKNLNLSDDLWTFFVINGQIHDL